MNCRVVVEAAVPVYDVESPDEAVRIAISKTGEMLNPDLNYVEIDTSEQTCPHCGTATDPAFVAADESLVALELEMTVYNVDGEQHAARIARKEIGQQLEDVPLEVLAVEEVADVDENAEAADSDDSEGDGERRETDQAAASATDGSAAVADETTASDVQADGSAGDAKADGTAGDAEVGESAGDSSASSDDDILPEFEELVDE